MADRYWVGGSGAWNATNTTNWSATSGGSSGASVPTITDNVIFDQTGTYTVTNSVSTRGCLDLTVSAGTVTIAGTASLNVAGSLSLVAGTSWTNTNTLTFISTTTGKTITTNGTVFQCTCRFNGAGGGWSLGSAMSISTAKILDIQTGSLNLNGFDMSCGLFSVTTAGTKSIAFGSNTITCGRDTDSSGSLNLADLTGFTPTYTTGGIVMDASIKRIIGFSSAAGPTATNVMNLTFSGTGSVAPEVTFSDTISFNKLDFGSTAFTMPANPIQVSSLTLSSAGTYTASNITALYPGGTLTSNGRTIGALTINSSGTTTLAGALTVSGALTLTQGTLACSTYSVSSATFASTGSLTRSMTGTGTYTITGTGATAFSNASSTGITMTGLTISMTGATAKTFAGGGGSFSTLNQGGAGALTISGNNSFANLTATTLPSTITFTAGSTQTFTAFTLSGTSGNLVTINSSTPGTQATLSKASGTVSAGFLSIQDSNATGGATWKATSSTNVSNNSGWTFSTIFYGSSNVTTIYYGSSPVSAIYYGSNRVY
jgi:hypothetical protein